MGGHGPLDSLGAVTGNEKEDCYCTLLADELVLANLAPSSASLAVSKSEPTVIDKPPASVFTSAAAVRNNQQRDRVNYSTTPNSFVESPA